jgi:hypothetical protein
MNKLNPNLTSPEVEAHIATLVAKTQAVDQEAAQALAEPLPGPTRDIFAVSQDIKVGKWSVRPFYDLDFVLLEELKHPMAKIMKASMLGENSQDDYIPSGPTAWELFWVMTRSIEETEGILLAADGRKALSNRARTEFGKTSFAVLVKLYEAVVRQIGICTSGNVAYGAPTEEGEARQAASPKSLAA